MPEYVYGVCVCAHVNVHVYEYMCGVCTYMHVPVRVQVTRQLHLSILAFHLLETGSFVDSFLCQAHWLVGFPDFPVSASHLTTGHWDSSRGSYLVQHCA